MGNQLNILVAGRHSEIVPTLVRLLQNNPDWKPKGTLTNEEAMACMATQPISVLLLSSGINERDELELRNHLAQTHPDAIIIQHYGGGSGLLVAEIYQALAVK